MRVLVTGASRGIGRAVAQRLHGEGHVLALSARGGPNLAAVLAETPGSHGLPADLLLTADAEALVGRAVAALGGLDALVCCAGIVHYASALETGTRELAEQLQLNTIAPFLLSQQAGRHLAAAGGGSIVHVASTLGVRPAPDTAGYAASKAALISLTRSFALELGPSDVRVNAIAPGVVDTDMIRVARRPGVDVAAQLQELAALHPLGRLGQPAQVAEAVSYLLGARFVTGSVLTLDGGLLLNA